jgi:hypothetical protein
MNQPPKLSWSEITVLAFFASGSSWAWPQTPGPSVDALYALGFLAFIFFAAWLQQRTIRNASPNEPDHPDDAEDSQESAEGTGPMP